MDCIVLRVLQLVRFVLFQLQAPTHGAAAGEENRKTADSSGTAKADATAAPAQRHERVTQQKLSKARKTNRGLW